MEKPIGIIGAMQAEVAALIADMTEPQTEVISGVTFVSGKIAGRAVVVATCGIGKVFAAICAEAMILRYQPAMILNTGVAGTLSDLTIGQIAIADQVVQHDMDTSPIGDPVGLLSGINKVYLPCDAQMVSTLAACAAECGQLAKVGTIASGDQFIADAAVKNRITSAFSAIAAEMEGAAIGHVCYVNDLPFCVVRAISDGGDEAAHTDYPTFLAAAAKASYKVVKAFLSKI